MIIRLRTFLFPVCLAICFLVGSCQSFLDIEVSPQLIGSQDAFATDATARSAVDGLYTQLRMSSLSLFNGGLSIHGGLMADELHPTATNAQFDPFFSNTVIATNATILSQYWRAAYQTIYRANAAIGRLEKSGTLNPAVKDRLLGEARFIRALHYLYLAALFGDVPLVLGIDYTVNATMPRTSADTVLAQVLADLLEAQASLPETYEGAGRIRPNRWAAVALLARLQLQLGDHSAAAERASAVLDAEPYTLAGDLRQVFPLGSPETIWAIAPAGGFGNTVEVAYFLPSGSAQQPQLALSDGLMALFDEEDLRGQLWVGASVSGERHRYHAGKYRQPRYDAVAEYPVVLRLAELYLIRAEARLHLGDLDGARKDLDAIRLRAGLEPLAANTDMEALAALLRDERQRELFTEWGHRWFDLKRWDLAETVLGSVKPGFKPAAQWFPIPQDQILYNPNLTQNNGF